MALDKIIELENLTVYQRNIMILADVNITIEKGEFVYLIGKTGTGKSSLLKTLYADLPVTEGSAIVADYQLKGIKKKDIPYLRRKLGIVFQDFQLLIDRSVSENLKFVLKATGWKDKVLIDERINEVLDKVGLNTKGFKMPHQLSGGEQQRIVIARALLNTPEMILADEPTGNLDAQTGKEVIDLLYNIRKSGTTVVMATHNLNWVELYPGRIFSFEDEEVREISNLSKVETVTVKEIVDFEDNVVIVENHTATAE